MNNPAGFFVRLACRSLALAVLMEVDARSEPRAPATG